MKEIISTLITIGNLVTHKPVYKHEQHNKHIEQKIQQEKSIGIKKTHVKQHASKKINGVPPHKRQLNTIFQRYALFPHLDVYENIAFGLKLKKVPYLYKKN